MTGHSSFENLCSAALNIFRFFQEDEERRSAIRAENEKNFIAFVERTKAMQTSMPATHCTQPRKPRPVARTSCQNGGRR